MKKHILRFREVDRDSLNNILRGKKTVETRAATTKFKNIQKGDMLVFVCGKNKAERLVKKVSLFKSIKDLFDAHPVSSVVPRTRSLKDAAKRFYSFPGYKEKIKKFGIIAFEI